MHPILYYWMLHILNLIFGNNIIIYRLFSVLGIVLLGILGFTHIRKDFGEKVGIIFSYLAFFMSVMCVYAVEIRMYTLAIFLSMCTFIYAYRILKQYTIKNWTIFAICSLALSYTHYYGLMAAGLINIGLFVFALRNKEKDKTYLKRFLIQAVIEILLYIPWLLYFVMQVMHVGGGFWISLKFPDTLIEVISFQYRGIMDGGIHFDLETIGTFAFAILLYIYIGYIIYKEKKQNKDIKIGLLAGGLYLVVILAALIISKFMVILYSRYLFTITGILIFAIAYFMARDKRKIITIIMLGAMLLMSIYNEYRLVVQNYDDSNMKQIEYVRENIKPDDIIIYSDVITNSCMSIYFPNNKQYFLNLENWDVEEAYKAYAPQMETVRNWDFLNDFSGRIWIMDTSDQKLYNILKEQNINVIYDNKVIDTKYHYYNFNIMLIEK